MMTFGPNGATCATPVVNSSGGRFFSFMGNPFSGKLENSQFKVWGFPSLLPDVAWGVLRQPVKAEAA